MQVKSRLVKNFTRDFETGELIVSFTVPKEAENDFKEFVNALGDKEIDLKFEKFKVKKKRSLDANAYFWLLCSKLAEKHGRSKEEEYEDLLRDYGTFEIDEDGRPRCLAVEAEIKDDVVEIFTAKGFHLKYFGIDHKGQFCFGILKGSSEYNSIEMHHLLEGTINICKEEGIEVLPPWELERLWQQYQ